MAHTPAAPADPAKLSALVIASGNKGKIAEITAACAGTSLQLLTQESLGISSAPEPHATFLENALAKARHAAQLSGRPALSDDSGLVVPALGNAPGVYSARYAGAAAAAADNNAKLLAAMQGITDRRAFYYAAMVLVLSPRDPAPLFAEGYWHGEIAAAPAGSAGFGYDPLFYCPRLQKTGGEMTRPQKQRVSHRGQSLRRLLRLLRLRRLI